MGTLGDIAGLLEKLPAWQKMLKLAERVEQLEARLAAIEAASAGKTLGAANSKEACPYCGAHQWFLKEEKRHPIQGFHDMGVRIHLFECRSCGKTKECSSK